MPVCKNDPKRKYKGDEPSPKGLGWCAHGEKEGKVRKGLDGNKWIVKKINNGSMRWVKNEDGKPIKESVKQIQIESVTKNIKINNKWFRKLTASQKNTYKTLITVIKKELENVGIKVIIYPLYLSDNGYYFIDYAWHYAGKIVDDEDPFIIIVLKINYDILDLPKSKIIHIQHSNITYKNKKNLMQIFCEIFGNKYEWNGKQTHTINIKL